MLKNKFVTAAAALAFAVPLAIASPSFAQVGGHGGHGGHGGGHGGAHMGGHMGGARMGGGGTHFSARVGGGGGGTHFAGGRGWHGGGGHWHGGHRHGGGGFFPGVVAGALVGGALASSGPYYYDDDYGYYDDGPAVEVVPGGVGDSVAYCQQRYRSYDVASGTYLGYDGLRHPCP